MKSKFLALMVLLTMTNLLIAQVNTDSTTLDKAVVRKKTSSLVNIVNDRYASRGMFKNTVNVKMLDYINNPPPPSNLPILEYLRGKLVGVNIERGANGNYVITSGRFKTLMDEAEIKIYLDEQLVDADFLENLFPRDVALVKYFQPGASMSTALSSSSGTLAIYTRKGEDIYNFNDKNELNNIRKTVDSLKKGNSNF